MKLKLYAFAFAATCSMLLQAQQSYMASADVAVFYPARYDAARASFALRWMQMPTFMAAARFGDLCVVTARPSSSGMSIRLAMAWMAVLIFIRGTLGFSVFAATVQALALLPIIRGRRR